MDVVKKILESSWKYKSPLVFAGAWLAWMFSTLSLTNCNFMLVGNSNDERLGLLSRSYVDEQGGERLGCVKYSSSDHVVDSLFKAGRVFGVMTVLCASLVVSLMSAVLLWKSEPKTRFLLWNIAHLGLVAATVFQVLSFIALGSNRCIGGCTLKGAGVLAVFNIGLLSLLSTGLFFLPLPPTPWLLALWQTDDPNNNTLTGRKQQNAHEMDDQATGVDRQQPESSVGSVEISESFVSESSQTSDLSSDSKTSIQGLTSFRLSTVILIAVAWAISIMGVQRCTFAVVKPKSYSQSSVSSELGLYSHAVDNNGEFLGCVAYPNHTVREFDGAFRAARAFGAITTLLTTGVFVLGILQLAVMRLVKGSWYAFRAMLPAATITQLVAFVAFGSEKCSLQGLVECHPGGTGVVVILNVFLMVTLSALVILVPPPENPVFKVFKLRDHDETSRPTDLTSPGVAMVNSVAERSEMSHNSQTRPNDVETDEDSYLDEIASSNATRHVPSRIQYWLEESTGDVACGATSITVKVEYNEKEKTTTKISTHADGSQTITTITEELMTSDDDGSEVDDDITEDGHVISNEPAAL